MKCKRSKRERETERRACPALDEYWHAVDGKTAALFRLAVALLALFSAQPADLVARLARVVTIFGRCFQAVDDLLNMSAHQEAAKGRFDDLLEGKFSFPIVVALQCCSAASPGEDVASGGLLQRLDRARLPVSLRAAPSDERRHEVVSARAGELESIAADLVKCGAIARAVAIVESELQQIDAFLEQHACPPFEAMVLHIRRQLHRCTSKPD